MQPRVPMQPRLSTRLRVPKPLTAAAVTLAALAASLAGWAGSSWYSAAHADSRSFAQTRDQVLAAGEQAVQNLNTLDWRQVDRGLDSWQDSTTGDLHDQLVQGRTAFTKQVRQARTVTAAKVLSGAVTELDDRAGQASVMVAVRITVTPQQGRPADKDSRMLGRLTRTQAGWKLSGLGQAPTGESAADPSAVTPTGAPSPSAAAK